MDKLFSTFTGQFSALLSLSKHDDNWVDRCHHVVSVVIMIVCAICVSMKHWVGDPIECWLPDASLSPFKSYIGKCGTMAALFWSERTLNSFHSNVDWSACAIFADADGLLQI